MSARMRVRLGTNNGY
ncbi:hypothetical protein MTR67_007464 [Solanum verrucosum]|uniref:Uncharacterized protein n=1 Tax=Solanum verrucosum TaxID=315347 RepID=A0AAF0TD47_SOLVR|nr:hypothetical protein MTR67_007464 [Solanum verrucosum]